MHPKRYMNGITLNSYFIYELQKQQEFPEVQIFHLSKNEIYDERFLIRRPLMRALEQSQVTPVLLIDEVDRADDEFEAFLLEILSDYSVTVPEIGTIKADNPPVVIITSNRTRDVHDALKRRCLYHWVEHPGIEQEVEILRVRSASCSVSVSTPCSCSRRRTQRHGPLQATWSSRDY